MLNYDFTKANRPDTSGDRLKRVIVTPAVYPHFLNSSRRQSEHWTEITLRQQPPEPSQCFVLI